jgi:alpha-galactosidase
MQTVLELNDLHLPVQANSYERLDHGILLRGASVALLHPFGETLYYRHGWHSWSLSSWLPLSKTLATPLRKDIWPQIDHPALLADYPFTSSGLTALQSQDGRVLLLGALALDAQLKADAETLRGKISGDVSVDPEWFLAFGPEQSVFESYTKLLANRFGALGSGHPRRVWCSWYSLFTDISEESLAGILPGLAGLPFDVFQVDDGWQASLGDWEPNNKFPSGMAALAGKIRAAGYSAGLWLAPFAVQPRSRLFQEHPDWLLRDEHGELVIAGHNWGDNFFGLDVTHPGAQKWLTDLILQVCSWGFDYLKLDFLYASALAGNRYQKLSGEMAFHKGLEIIRHAAGDEVYVLACGAPVLASLGLANGLRIGPDVAPFWDNVDRSHFLHDLSGPGTLNAIRTTLHRLWLRPLIHVDPDVAFFRTQYNLLNPAQKALLLDLVQITGFRATSDLPAWLTAEERQALLAFLQASPSARQVGRYRFQLQGREVDFSAVPSLLPD